MVVVAGPASVYVVLDKYAKKHSGCYLFNRATKKQCRINLLSGNVSSANEQCYSDVKLTEKVQTTPKYKQWYAKPAVCDAQLCSNKNLVEPYSDEDQYSVSCIEIDAIDALSDIVADTGELIFDTVGSFVSIVSKALLPVALTCGGLYVMYKVAMKGIDNEFADDGKSDNSSNPKKRKRKRIAK
uniref:Uncharacterized protein n=1 Tax=Glypta fumiferanae TaxID=389681 RepID=A0A0F6Q8B7_9HYME|nr:hypothetical protein [Glypta fumiferanae]